MHIPHARALHNKLVSPRHVSYLNLDELTRLFDKSCIAINFVTNVHYSRPLTGCLRVLKKNLKVAQTKQCVYSV